MAVEVVRLKPTPIPISVVRLRPSKETLFVIGRRRDGVFDVDAFSDTASILANVSTEDLQAFVDALTELLAQG